MILTLTPNPSLDRTVTLPGPLQRGAVQRLTGVVMEPGGKGVNVARVLSNAGRAATTVLPAAENDPHPHRPGRPRAARPHRAIRARGRTRPHQHRRHRARPAPTTKLNELGGGA